VNLSLVRCRVPTHLSDSMPRDKVYKALGYEKNFYYFSDGGNGTHCQYQIEADSMLRNAVRAFLKRTQEPNGGFQIHNEYDSSRKNKMYGNLSDRADWTTPTLQ
jgi:hypothetical protein